MAQETLYDLFFNVLQEIAKEIITFLPKMILAVVIFVIAILTIRILNKVFSRILTLVNIDKMFYKAAKIKLPFSLSNFIIILIDIGILLIAILGIINFFLSPQQMEFIRGIFGYGARIFSVIAIILFTFIMFNVLIERVRIETRMRGYVVFILLILTTMMIIDLTALSSSTKNALNDGLSIGLGIAVGIFAVWFFFHEYIDRFLDMKKV